MKFALCFALLTSVVPAAALACDGEAQNTQAWWSPEQPAKLPQQATVDQVVRWARQKSVVTFDANTEQVRAAQGIIPGAVLLTSSTEYPLAQLPADKHAQLLFYCMNQKCSASHQAAQRALQAGYTKVAVLPVGITGWKAAGQPTAKSPGST